MKDDFNKLIVDSFFPDMVCGYGVGSGIYSREQNLVVRIFTEYGVNEFENFTSAIHFLPGVFNSFLNDKIGLKDEKGFRVYSKPLNSVFLEDFLTGSRKVPTIVYHFKEGGSINSVLRAVSQGKKIDLYQSIVGLLKNYCYSSSVKEINSSFVRREKGRVLRESLELLFEKGV